MGFRGSSLGHIQMAAVGVVWLQAARSPALLWGVFLQGRLLLIQQVPLSTLCLLHSCCALLCYKAACCEHEDTVRGNMGYSSPPALAAVI